MSVYEKAYVPVEVSFDERGFMHPVRLIGQDGKVFEIDRVIQIKPAAAMKAGGQGDRYTIRIAGKETYLFFERSTSEKGAIIGRWFVEKKIS